MTGVYRLLPRPAFALRCNARFARLKTSIGSGHLACGP